MHTAAGRPDPLGQADIARQHQALRVEIGELSGVIDSCPAPQRTERYHQLIAVLVTRLGDRLRTHVALEEDSGGLPDIAASYPLLAGDVARLRRAHVEMVHEGQRLAESLRAPLAPPDAIARVQRWLDAIRSHEVEELELVQRAETKGTDAGH